LGLINIWPCTTKLSAKIAEKTNASVVAEINNGQIIKEVKESTNRKIPIVLSSKLGGIVHTPKEILMKIEEVAKK